MIWLVIIVYKKVKHINWLFAPSTNFWIWLVGNIKQPIVDKLVKYVTYELTGCCLQLSGVCQDGHRFNWSSSEFHTNKNQTKIFDINLLMASAVVVSGNSFTKVKMLFNFMNLAIISKTTFYSYQCRFICPGVNTFYLQEQVCIYYVVFT